MTTGGAWPVPPSEPVVVLVDAHGAVERDVLDRWVRNERPLATSPGDVGAVRLPDPSSSENDAALAALGRELASGRDPWLTPVRVAWLPRERGGERSVRVRDVLRHLGDPRHPRAWSQRRIVRSEPDRCRVVVGEPARVSDLRRRWTAISGDDRSPLAFTQFVARQATLALERAESRLVGARYKVPRLVREELMATARFRAGLARLAGQLGRDEEGVTSEAESYLKEMVTGWTRLLVDLGVRLGRYNFRRGYDPELDFDAAQVAMLRGAAEQHPLVFLPSHKSNLDTLVLNVALHDNGLPRTHVIGGINMAFWPIGPLFRRAGTIYIRRETKGNPVYRFTLREYIGYLIEKRFSLQFYIEGGRSRIGKLLPPRLGLLTYVVDAFRQGRSDDAVLVPVSIAYDQLQEVGEFAREAKGASKSAESMAWLVRAFREQRGRFGKIYVRFGAPLSLRQVLGPPGRELRDPDAARLALQKVAFEVSRRINEVTPITATSLVALSLLGAQGRALTLEQIRATVHDPLHYSIRRGLPMARQMRLDTEQGVLRALGELERHRVVTRYAAGPDPVFAIGTDQHLAAAFYRNTVIHFFLHGALAQAALARVARSDVGDPAATFWDAVLATRDLLKFEFFFEPRDEFRATIAAELAYQDPAWEARLAEQPKGARELLEQYRPITAHTVLRSFLEAYGVVAAALVRHEGEEVDRRQFLGACLALGRQYQLQQRIRSPESLSKPFFSNALDLAANRGLVGPASDRKARRSFLDELRRAIRDIDFVESVVTDRILTLMNAEPGESDRAD